MLPVTDSIRRKPFTWFILVTFGVSWTAWLLQATRPNPMDGQGIALFFIGGIGPLVGALVAADRTEECTFRMRLLRFRVLPARYIVALSLPFVMVLGFLVFRASLQNGQISFESLAPIGVYPGMLLSGIIFGGLEEPGWRGFAQYHLQARYSWLTASLLVGGIWVFWHVPLFLIPGTAQARIPFISFALMGIGLSILFGWFFNWATGSVPVLVLLHGGFNAAQGWARISEDGMTILTMVVVVWTVVLLIIIASWADRQFPKYNISVRDAN